jgi:hypothetical protein
MARRTIFSGTSSVDGAAVSAGRRVFFKCKKILRP